MKAYTRKFLAGWVLCRSNLLLCMRGLNSLTKPRGQADGESGCNNISREGGKAVHTWTRQVVPGKPQFQQSGEKGKMQHEIFAEELGRLQALRQAGDCGAEAQHDYRRQLQGDPAGG